MTYRNNFEYIKALLITSMKYRHKYHLARQRLAEINPGMGSANERFYIVTLSLIGWTHT